METVIASIAVALALQVGGVPACNDVEVCDAIQQAAETHGVSYSLLTCLAFRESSYNPNAQNGRYGGLMQFDETTWAQTRWPWRSRYDPYAAADGAAYLISLGQGSRWPPLRYC